MGKHVYFTDDELQLILLTMCDPQKFRKERDKLLSQSIHQKVERAIKKGKVCGTCEGAGRICDCYYHPDFGEICDDEYCPHCIQLGYCPKCGYFSEAILNEWETRESPLKCEKCGWVEED